MVVNRDREIEAFNSEEFFTLSTTVKGCKLTNSKKYTDKNEVDDILKELKKEDLVIKDVKTSTKSEKPNKLFDLTSLQVFCNNAFGYSAEDTLNATQSLYEKKLLTYPRVDTCYLTNDIYKECPSILSSLKGGYDYINKLDLNNLQKRKMVFDDSKVTDHHAIIPTGRQMWNLSEIESNVFDSVVKRFICVFYPDYIYDETNVIAESAGIEFKTNGRIVKDLGFYEVLNTQPSDNIIPDFAEGEVLSHKPKIEKKSTTPPQAFTEATLLRAMETAGKIVEEQEFKDAMKENGIGRPSTRASIIETLVKRGYLYKEKKKILSTDLGKKLIDSIDNELLKSVKLTGEWEYKLRKIERGEYDSANFLAELKTTLNKIIKK
jgi:DNA topoisomerase-3